MVIRRGRPAKAGERYPSGDLKRRPGEQHHAVLPRVRELYRVAQGYNAVKALALDPRMSPDYAPGQLFLLGLVSAGELEDGSRVARIYGRFERLHGKRRSSASPDYRLGRGRGYEPDDDAEAIEEDFALLRDALLVYGASALAAVEQFWVEGRHLDGRALPEILRVTSAARRQFDKVRKRRKAGAASARLSAPVRLTGVDETPLALPPPGRGGRPRSGREGVNREASVFTPPGRCAPSRPFQGRVTQLCRRDPRPMTSRRGRCSRAPSIRRSTRARSMPPGTRSPR